MEGTAREQRLAALLRTNHWVRCCTHMDGNCQFASIALALCHARQATLLVFSKNGCQHAIGFKCLPAFCGLRRRKCYKSPTNSRSDERPGIGCKRIGRSTRRPARRTYAKTVVVRLASFLSSEAFIYEDWEDYLANLRRPAQSNRDGGYSDHVSLQAFANTCLRLSARSLERRTQTIRS